MGIKIKLKFMKLDHIANLLPGFLGLLYQVF